MMMEEQYNILFFYFRMRLRPKISITRKAQVDSVACGDFWLRGNLNINDLARLDAYLPFSYTTGFPEHIMI